MGRKHHSSHNKQAGDHHGRLRFLEDVYSHDGAQLESDADKYCLDVQPGQCRIVNRISVNKPNVSKVCTRELMVDRIQTLREPGTGR